MKARARRNLTSVRRRLPAAVLMLVVVALCIAGVIYKGAEITQVNVNDGGIWVTNKSKQMVGHLDYEARILDGALRTEATNFDVGQAAETVTVSDLTSLTVAPVNVTQVALESPTSLPSGSVVMQGGDVLGVFNATNGTLWTTSATSPNPTSLSEGAAVASNMGDSAFVTGMDGTVYALSASGTLTTVKRQGAVDQAKTSIIEGIPADATLSMTVVGDQVVALDSTTNTLFLPGGKKLNLSAAGVEDGGVLQQAGPKADSVLLATASSLVTIPLKGAAPTIVPAAEGAPSGTPAAPVRHEGCSYGAWTGSGAYVRSCDDPGSNKQMIIDTLRSAKEIVFRTNRKAIVLNDVAQGSVWLPDSNMVLMDNWDEVEKQLEENEEEDKDNPELTNEVADPEKREQNTPPEAVDDEFGIRPGRSTVLPVLDNDSDLDGDVLTASPTSQPAWGTVTVARAGRALQIADVGAQQTGSTSFSYEASDGKDSATAHVQVTIHPYGENEAPVQLRASSVKIGAGAQIQYQALSDWRDPDGDPIYLKDAQAPEGLNTSFTEDGSLTITEEGSAAGPKTVVLTVADDQGGETRGELIVDVQEAGNLPPTANGDLYQAHPGETITLDPLRNDTDPNGDPLSLAAVSGAPSGASITPDLDRGTIDFMAASPGSYSFAYTVSDGIATTLGIVRVEVAEAQALPPVAENDTAVLPQGGSVLVAPLANDYDPSGGVLAITSVDSSAVPGLEVALIDRHLLRVTAPSGLDAAASFSYTISNGQGSASATVTVIPGATDRSDLPPVLKPDRGKVRVGDVGTVSVLSNDRSPAGLNLQVESTLEYDRDSAVGTPFVTGNQVRLEAGDTPGTMDVTYSVIDSAGNRASSTVTFEVLAASDTNQAPRPRDITAWASAGQTTRIPVTLDGIDPDGDSVSLRSVDSSPQKGSATAKATWIEYTPNDNASGTDTFTYTVEDRQGARASARVRVAVTSIPALNQNPVAVPDTVLTRPDRMVTVNVLANDLDPDGDSLSLDDGGLQTSTPGLDPQVRSSSSIQVHTPSQAGTYLVSYTVSDGRGGSARGTLTVFVQDDAPLKAPIARDDFVSYDELPTDGSAVRVNVLENDEDPDGSIDEVSLTTSESGVSVSGSDLLIPVTDSTRLVVYTITDRDGLTNSAVVTVPGRNSTAPFLSSANLPIEMDAGTSRTISLSDYVATRAGRSPRLVEGSSPVPQDGLDSVVADSDTQLTLNANADFGGNSAFLIQVADGDSSDAGALSASLSLPVRIKATKNQPPTFTPTAIRVEAGGEAVTQNLALAVRDPEGVDTSTFTYTMDSAPNSIQASLTGTTLTVSAPEGTPKGSAGSIAVSVTDEDNNTVSAQIPVEVVVSDKPLIQVPAYTLTTKVGDTVSVDVASSATNPYPESPITLESATLSAGSATVATSGTTVSVTPSASGTITVGFKVNDKLGDPARAVQGTITVTVTDKPAAPTNVRAEAEGPNGARVTFDAPESNGSPITEYRVYDQTGRQVATCSTNVCSVAGLSVGQTYSFTVEAVNKEGDSDPSKASNTITISGVPGRPGAPLLTAGDGTITATWARAKDNGSPVTGYTATASLAGGSDATCSTNGDTTCTLTGLTNGKNYTVTVRARNARGESAASDGASATPQAARRGPDQPVITSASAAQQRDGNAALATITWSLGSSGTARWGETIVSVNGVTKNVTGGTTTTQMTVPYGVALTVYVNVSNANGDTATSPGYVIPAVVHEDPTPAKTTPLAPDAPRLGPPSDNALGKLRISNARLKEGNGYTAADLELFYADSEAGCKAPGNPLRLNNGDRGDFDVGPLTPGATMTYYFCQRGKKDDGSYVWSPVVSASGTVGNGQRSGPDDDTTIPVFNVSVTSYINSATVSWDVPSGVTIEQTNVWIKEMEGATKQKLSGPITSWAVSGLAPVNQYTAVVEMISKGGAHRTVEKTFKTTEAAENVGATFTGKTTCSNGQECGSMTLTAKRASQFGPGVTLVCTVSTGRPAQNTEFRFSRDTPSIPGILTEAITAKELNARDVVKSCRVE